MGWISYYREKGESDLDHFRREWGMGERLIATATKGNVLYGAQLLDNGCVGGTVALLQRGLVDRNGHNFAWKGMDETTGPFSYDCPERILDLLSPVEECYGPEPDDPDAYSGARNARVWREACRANIAAAKARPKVSKGDTVHLATPLEFRNDAKLDTFFCIDARRGLYSADGLRYRLPRDRSRWGDYTVTKGAAA